MDAPEELGWVDALVHLDALEDDEAARVLQRAAAAGVRHVIHGGVDPRTPPRQRSVAAPVHVWRAYGIHPSVVSRVPSERADALRCLAERLHDDEVVALGELGLDARPDMPPIEDQEACLREQLGLADAHGLPVILHCVHAIGRLVEILEDHGPLAAGGMLHAFGGPAELVPRLSALGLHFSFGTLVTRPAARRCRAAVSAVAGARLLVESDAPGGPSSDPSRPTREPADIPAILRAIAELREEPWSAVATQVRDNAHRLFRLTGRSRVVES